MDKRFQVFISSTYADLKMERQKVIQTVMEMDCIPAGMELFPAADEEQFEFIKSVIDDCDYYIIIIGGRYGSETIEGISYTEKEYDYAISKGLKVLVFLHEKPKNISLGKSDTDPEKVKKLNEFREKVATNRLVKFWNKAEELPGLVALSLSKTIKLYRAVGWIRGDQVSSTEILNEINTLRKENMELKKNLKTQEASIQSDNLDIAGIDEEYTFHGTSGLGVGRADWSFKISWHHLFGLIAPFLMSVPDNSSVKNHVNKLFSELKNISGSYFYLNDRDFETISIQLKALGLLTISRANTIKGGVSLFWTLTNKGENLMTEIRIIKKK